MTKSDTSWENVADWYDNLLNDKDSYQVKVILLNLLRLMKIEKGQKILDLACGQGFFATQFAKDGAEVIGIDASSSLIEKAKAKSKGFFDRIFSWIC